MNYLTTTEFGRLPQIRLTRQAVRQACIDGKIPGAFRVYEGGSWRIPESAVPMPAAEAKPVKKDLKKIKAEAIALCLQKPGERKETDL